MFDRRLKSLLAFFAVILVIILARLVDLQVVHGTHYRDRAQRTLVLRPKFLPFVRGRILDRTGKVLVWDEPCWNVHIDFQFIAADLVNDEQAMQSLVRQWRRSGHTGDSNNESGTLLHETMAATWHSLESFSRSSGLMITGDLREKAGDIYNRIMRVREAVARRRGFDGPVVEETTAHAVLLGLTASQQISAREWFAPFPWISIEPASTRKFTTDAEPLAHVLGRLGRVSAERIADDPNADNPFAAYRGDDSTGVSGVEAASESTLRGRRGRIVRDRTASVVEEIEAQAGEDVVLTVHMPLQQRLYNLLSQTVDAIPESSGGSIVVVDVATRELLALISYPAFDPSFYSQHYAALRDDTVRLPLRFRAVSNRYAPGSTIKPLVCLSGLMNGMITLDTRETCTGYLFEEHRDRWRCWQIHGSQQRKAHGSIDVVAALTGSCNVFMYRLGERLTVDGLCSAFDKVGIGRDTGLNLREESRGINPTPSWLFAHGSTRVTPGTARNFAIGQGELSLTPVQVANLMATYADGNFQPLTLTKNGAPKPILSIPASPEHWLAIRQGMYGVVNDTQGTAYQHAHYVSDLYALCGKTGSATVAPWPTAYRVNYTDTDGNEREQIVLAGAKRPAMERFVKMNPNATFDPKDVTVESRWPTQPPPPGTRHAHAWFGGFLQPLDSAGVPDWNETAPIAFAALVEFGGSGGRTSGPLARKISAALIEVLGPDLNPDAQEVALEVP